MISDFFKNIINFNPAKTQIKSTMKKNLLFCLVLMVSVLQNTQGQQRYLDEVFNNVTVTSNITYGKNLSVLGVSPTAPVLSPLKLDFYEPTGDTFAARPLVVYMHTGSFLPILYNKTTTGSKSDSTAVAMCSQFAKRGYVVASIDYRLGWNPQALGAAGQDIRTGTLLQAVYRAIQDAKTAVRYLDSTSNHFKIDGSKIMLCGQGSGGYVALAYATLDDFNAEVAGLPKFISGTTDLTYGFQAGQPYVSPALMGDFEGFGGNATFNYPNLPTYSSAITMSVNMGGALGDSTWLENGDVPMVCFHVPSDPFAPYTQGMVVVPTTGDNVVYVAGSYNVINRAEGFGNNDVFNIPYNDPYTTRANQVNNGHEGLFPFIQAGPQAAPWEWWDSTDLYVMGSILTLSNGLVDTIIGNSLLTNPNMSKAKALAYIDSIQGYLAPRMVQALALPGMYVGLENVIDVAFTIDVAPNPSSDNFEILSRQSPIQSYELYDITGKLISSALLKDVASFIVNGKDFSKGIYLLSVNTQKGKAVKKLVVE